MFTNLIKKNFLMLNEPTYVGGYDTGYIPTNITTTRDVMEREHLSFNGGTEIEPTLSVMQPLPEPIHNFPRNETTILTFEPDFVGGLPTSEPVKPSTLPINFGNTDTEFNPTNPTYYTTRENGTPQSLINQFAPTPEQQQQETKKKSNLLLLVIIAAITFYLIYKYNNR